jgi:hypothetical protein
MRDKESIGAVNEGTLQCESIQRLKQGRGRLCARERNDKVLLGLANGREGWPTLGLLLYFIFFILKPNRFGSVRFGLAGLGTPKPETEPDQTFSLIF